MEIGEFNTNYPKNIRVLGEHSHTTLSVLKEEKVTFIVASFQRLSMCQRRT